MKGFSTILACLAFASALLAACNDVGDCPGASAITPGGSCSGDNLECPYTLQTPSAACDGTSVQGGVPTSCTCAGGSWSCPSPIACDAAAGDDGSTPGDEAATPDGGAG